MYSYTYTQRAGLVKNVCTTYAKQHKDNVLQLFPHILFMLIYYAALVFGDGGH